MYWLLKSEPDVYSIDSLQKAHIDFWDGVRNYQARNFILEMKKDQLAFFYHSNCKTPGIAGLMAVEKEAEVDLCAFDSQSPYFCTKSSIEKPRWYGASFRFIHLWPKPLSLQDIKKSHFDFALTRKGNRLSVMPVDSEIFLALISLLNSTQERQDYQWHQSL